MLTPRPFSYRPPPTSPHTSPPLIAGFEAPPIAAQVKRWVSSGFPPLVSDLQQSSCGLMKFSENNMER